jgi:ElaB/YqjD/DUF883 family membrane-anchored ribosome-binding protein
MAEEAMDLRNDVDALREDLTKLRRDLGELIGSVKEVTKQGAGVARDRARAELEQRLDQLGDAYQSARKRGIETAEGIQQVIEERPLTSLALAFGAGLVLGKLLSGK